MILAEAWTRAFGPTQAPTLGRTLVVEVERRTLARALMPLRLVAGELDGLPPGVIRAARDLGVAPSCIADALASLGRLALRVAGMQRTSLGVLTSQVGHGGTQDDETD